MTGAARKVDPGSAGLGLKSPICPARGPHLPSTPPRGTESPHPGTGQGKPEQAQGSRAHGTHRNKAVYLLHWGEMGCGTRVREGHGEGGQETDAGKERNEPKGCEANTPPLPCVLGTAGQLQGQSGPGRTGNNVQRGRGRNCV